MPIATRLTSESHLPGVWETLRGEIARGRQAYVVYPVIEESRAELKAAITEFERLSHEVFPSLKLGLLHGRLKSAEKDAVMEQFRARETRCAGGDHGDRGGRGRAKCDLDGDRACGSLRPLPIAPTARPHRPRFGEISLHPGCAERCRRRRARAAGHDGAHHERLRDCRDGPAVARSRRIFGTRQHGVLGFHVANPLRDRELLELARREAFAAADDPESRAQIERALAQQGANWHRRYQLAQVG